MSIDTTQKKTVVIPVTALELILINAKLLDLDFRCSKYKGKSLLKDRMSKILVVVTTCINIFVVIGNIFEAATGGGTVADDDKSVDNTGRVTKQHHIHHLAMLYTFVICIVTVSTVFIQIFIVHDTEFMNKTFITNSLRSALVLVLQVPYQIILILFATWFHPVDYFLSGLQIVIEVIVFYSYHKALMLALSSNQEPVENVLIRTHTEILLNRTQSIKTDDSANVDNL
jgi:hypothetical protein